MKFTKDEVHKNALQYFSGDELAANVWITKYCLKDNDGNFLESTPDDTHKRLAKEFARIEQNYPNPLSEDEIYGFLKNFSYIIPQGSPMYGIGNNFGYMSLSNCTAVDSPSDSVASIFDTAKDMANLFKMRCGVGIDISSLRPEGMVVNNSAKSTTGAWSFADLYSYVCRIIGQCIAYDRKILTDTGLKEIQNITTKDRVWTRVGFKNVKNVLQNGKKTVYKIIDEYGYETVTSKEHVFLSLKDGKIVEKKVKDFSIGEPIILIPGKPTEKQMVSLDTTIVDKSLYNNSNRLNLDVHLPKLLNEDLAYFLGYSYGDGYVMEQKNKDNSGIQLACSNDHPDIKCRLFKIIKEQFGYDVKISKGDGNLENYSIHSRVIVNFLLKNNILKQKSELLEMPKLIFDSPSKVQMAFVAGYFDADGYASGKKKGYSFASVSKKFLNDIKLILMSNGIITRTHVEKREHLGWKDLFCINITGGFFEKKFLALVPSIKARNIGFVANRDSYLTPYNSENISIKYSKHSYINNTQYFSCNVLERLKNDGEIIEFEHLVQSKVLQIEECGEVETYDLALDDEHLFFCDGFYVHNSGRRGALMISMSVEHPDIEKFITMKRDLTKVTGANISVKLTDKFMNAMVNQEKYEQKFPIDSKAPTISRLVDARKVWDLIVETATQTAEPGILFWDTICKNLPANEYDEFKCITTNPCSEIPLSGYDACRLIAVNLKSFVNNPFQDDCFFDEQLFKRVVKIATRLSDDLVDLEVEKIDNILAKEGLDESEKILWNKIKKAAVDGRRVGLGITGLADMLSCMKIKYDSQEAIDFVDKLFEDLKIFAYSESISLSKQRGSFSKFDWNQEKDNGFIQRLPEEIINDISIFGRRNISILTCAPAGSISLLAQVSSGIEPVFRNSYIRRRKVNPNQENKGISFVDSTGDRWEEYEVFHHNILKWRESNPNATLPEYFVESDKIGWQKRVEIQGIITSHIDHSISSTINLPRGTEPSTVGEIYLKSWRSGLKGVTVYVDGSRDGVLLSKDNKKSKEDIFPQHNAPKRPNVLECDIHHTTIKGTKWVTFVGLIDNKPYEIFAGQASKVEIPKKYKYGKIVKAKEGKNGQHGIYNLISGEGEEQITIKDIIETFDSPSHGSFTRLLSTAMRHGTPVQFICEQLVKDNNEDFQSFSKVLARVLKKYIPDGEKPSGDKHCEECKTESLAYKDGCVQCLNCGWSKCS